MSDPQGTPTAAEETVAGKNAKQLATEAVKEAQGARAEMREALERNSAEVSKRLNAMRAEFMGGLSIIGDELKAALKEATMSRAADTADAVNTKSKPSAAKGRVVSDAELGELVDRMTSEDAAQLHVFIAAKAESELWAERGINPATHVIATEPLKLMYDGKPIRTVAGKDYERAKFNPADLAQYGDTHFTAPRLTK